MVLFAADVSLTMLSDRVHRGSLANARSALDERMAAARGAQVTLREFEARRRAASQVARKAASG